MSIFEQISPDFLKSRNVTSGPFRQMFNYSLIWRWAILLTSAVTLLPLILITAVDYNFTQKSIESENLLRTLRVASNARRAISFFLSERKSALSFIVHDKSVDDLNNPEKLAALLKNLRDSFGGFVDLGVIDKNGFQTTYVGPYTLEGKDYSDQQWFKEVQEKGFHISDVFLGFRKVPHLVIAVRHNLPDGSFYILRTALDTILFNEHLSSLELSGRGDAFLINHQGIIQTPTRYQSKIFEKIAYAIPAYSDNTEIREDKNIAGDQVIICSAYIPDSPYILMIVKHKKDMMQSWSETRLKLIGFLAVSITVILMVILGFSTYLVNNVYLADQRRLMILHEMEYSNKLASIGRLAAGVAHEINNPLAIINEKAGLIKDLFTYVETYAADARILGLIDSILASVERCGTITKRLLGFARHMEVTIESISLEKVLDEVLGFLQKEAEYRNIAVNLDIAADIPEFQSDRGKLQQIFLNIVNNAFGAMDVGGKLDIAVRQDDTQHIITRITDNGCGMSEEDLGKIYEPFYSTKTKTGGTGLGLSITYGLVQELGGKIHVTSKKGAGTTFTVSLPLEPPPKTAEK
ncbi:MAG: ATP-binding protein [Desulfoprunum sp.]|nr:ATP-binding protein [Desulfoprunum sp.]